MNDDYYVWAGKVLEACNEDKNWIVIQKAIDYVRNETGEVPPLSHAPLLLEWLRGDEPRDCCDNGDTPSEYAKFLLEEYTLFGPEGE
jgi:hypothetical protein